MNLMYINHDVAKKNFRKMIDTELPGWIIISGIEKSGKSSFVKEVCKNEKTIFFEPKYELSYLEYIFKSLDNLAVDIIKNFFAQKAKEDNIILEVIGKVKFLNDINKNNFLDIVDRLLDCPYTYEFCGFLGVSLFQSYKYIVFDNFYMCDHGSYRWIIEFTEKYRKMGGYIIVICDIGKKWHDQIVYNQFCDIKSLVDISKFGASKDYYDVLKEKIYFHNDNYLHQVALNLFNLYKGSSQLLFKTILKCAQIKGTDQKKYNDIMDIARHYICADTLDETNALILGTIAISPIKLYTKEISFILQYDELFVNDATLKYEKMGILERATSNGLYIYYNYVDSSIKKALGENLTEKQKKLIFQRLYVLGTTGEILLSLKEEMELALYSESINAEVLLKKYISMNRETITQEDLAKYLNQLYQMNVQFREEELANLKYAKLLYEYGYYQACLNMMLYLQHIGKYQSEYNFYMQLGDVQHLLLHKDTPKTYRHAAKLEGITIDQKLRAATREIMALNQSNIQDQSIARKQYDLYLEQYRSIKCDALIELYRNTNNSYLDEQALEYTIKGYNLAIELDNELEKYKCIHNICMIRLHQNTYFSPLERQDISIEPNFEMVYDYLLQLPQYVHERAYPLLDLGTVEMFRFLKLRKAIHLKQAKNYYSQGQIYAKSYYAKNIAEMGLLIVNSHLYNDEEEFTETISQMRKDIYYKYSTENQIDYRVNRKILLSLAVSAIIMNSKEEAADYLKNVQKYMSGKEIGRYNKLCELADIAYFQIEAPIIPENQQFYYACPEFVPWLISFGH